nr:reverse transcriptase domain-containing protein [Tanacetum cinerariifolium]
MSIPRNNQGPPPASPPPQNNNGPAPDLRSMEELYQPHIDKFLEVIQLMKQNGVSDDALRLSLFPYSLTHHATAWYDRLPRNSIQSFDDIMRKFLSKYFPPSMVTKLRNEIMNFRQDPNKSLFEAWEHYKLSIDRCLNYNMLLVTQIDTFYNGLTLRHQDTINAAAGGTFMKKRTEECYDLIENMTTHHNHWDTSATRDETSRTISSTTNTKNPEEVERELEVTRDKVQTTSSESTAHVQPPVVQVPILEPDVASKPNPKLLIPYPSRLNDQKLPVLLKKLPEKLGDPRKFLIPCDFLELEEFLALADLGASINLMSLFVWKNLSLPKLTPTRMTLELANRSGAYPVGVAEDVFVKVGKFYFLTDFVVVDYDVDPRVPLILGRHFLRTERALIDIHSKELTLQVNDEAITFKVGHTLRYSRNYYEESVNQINIIDVACEEYDQEVLGFLDSSTSGNPTPLDPIIASSSPSFTLFERGNFILEEIKTFLRTPDELSNLDDDYYDTEGDIIYLEKLLNEDPSLNLPSIKNEDLKQADVNMTKPSIEEPLKLELKDLPISRICIFRRNR